MKTIGRSLPLLALLACALTSRPAVAQEAPAVAPGSRVRIYVSTRYNSAEVASMSRYHLGNVASIDSSAVTLVEESGTEFRIPFSAIRQLDVSRGTTTAADGRRIGMRKGALIGAGVAVGAFGLAYGVTAGGDKLAEANCEFEYLDCGSDGLGRGDFTWELAGTVAVIGTAAGALLGTFIGSAGRERWEGVPLRSLRRVQLAPAANGGTSISLRF
jgi:hypothetical protein